MKLEFDPAEYLPLREVVFKTLRNAIIRGEMKPGERLMEEKLAKSLEVSRTPVREAIRMLELEGLVVMLPRKGAEVARITVEDLQEDPSCDTKRRGQPSGEVPTASHILIATVPNAGSVIRMPWTRYILHLAVIAGSGVAVADNSCDGASCRPSVQNTAEKLRLVTLLTRRGIPASAGGPSVQEGLQYFHIDGLSSGNTIDTDPNGGSMGFPKD